MALTGSWTPSCGLSAVVDSLGYKSSSRLETKHYDVICVAYSGEELYISRFCSALRPTDDVIYVSYHSKIAIVIACK